MEGKLSQVETLVNQLSELDRYANRDLLNIANRQIPYQDVDLLVTEFREGGNSLGCFSMELSFISLHRYTFNRGNEIEGNFKVNHEIFKKYLIKYMNRYKRSIFNHIIELMREDIIEVRAKALEEFEDLKYDIENVYNNSRAKQIADNPN